MTGRRDFLKLFGVGAAVVPVIAGMPSAKDQAIIVEPPKLAIPEPSTILTVTGMPDFGVSDCVVFIRDRKTSRVMRMEAATFITEFKHTPIDAAGLYNSMYGEYFPGPTEITFKVIGTVNITT